MRLLIQRVKEASVTIEGEVKSEIQQGLLVLVGFEDDDTYEDLEWGASKITKLRIFDDSEGVMNLPITDINGELLIVSQFTLQALTKKGNRPSYIKAAHPDKAVPLYKEFVDIASKLMAKPSKTGEFGADMKVALINDGPVTIWMDTKNKE